VTQSRSSFPDWTEYDDTRLGGRDFLGLQSVGDAMLELLLPGMTNATRHPRYYAYFCWLFQRAHHLGLTVKQTRADQFRHETALVYAANANHTDDFGGVIGILGARRGPHAWQGPQKRYTLSQDDWGRRASAFSAFLSTS
jgi:hypothetical protein